jgi:hypothetical protein
MRVSECTRLILSAACAAGVTVAQGEDASPAFAPSVAQESQQPVPARALGEATGAGRDPFHTPIHTAVADPVGGTYGTWAAGSRYKVSFHDGMAFYPVLGADYPTNLPLRWKTRSVRAGGQELVTTEPRPSSTAWRFEYDLGGVTEVYEVRTDGLEQMFVVRQRPAAGGDLVVEGEVFTALRAAERYPQHAALRFVDGAGNAILDYGAAVAVDANGARTAMTTSYDDGRIRLTLDGAWLAQAAFPLTVDPLLSTVIVATHSSAQASVPDVARDDEANQLCTTYGRAVSAGDYDLWARITDDQFGNTNIVFTDITTSWSTRYGDVAFVSGANRWVIALEREFGAPSNRSAIRVHLHDSGDLTNLTTYISLPSPAGQHDTLPDVGGTAGFSTGNHALIVFQRDMTASLANTANSDVIGVLFDASAGTAGTAFVLDPNGGAAAGRNDFDRERPAVTQISDGGTSSWVTIWQQYDNGIAGDDWDAIVVQVRSNGTLAGRSFVGNSAETDHAINPKVAGRGGRYMAMFGQQANTGTKYAGGWATFIRVHRFDWADGAAAPVKKELKTLQASRGSVQFWNGDIAYDHDTDSHWCAVTHSNDWIVYAKRIGYEASVVESATVYSGPDSGFSPGCVYNDDSDLFPIVYATNGTNFPVLGVRFDYHASTSTLYGVGCGPGVMGYSGIPHAGNEFYTVRLTGAPANVPAALIITFLPAAIPLNLIGMTGCVANFDPTAYITSVDRTTDAGGAAAVQLPLPGSPSADLYFQWAYFNIGANPLGVQATRGLRAEVR